MLLIAAMAAFPSISSARAESAAQMPFGGDMGSSVDFLLRGLDPTSPVAAEAVPLLISVVRNPDAPPSIRQRSALMLGRIGIPARAAIPLLIQLLQSHEEDVPFDSSSQYWAMRSLGLFGPVAAEAVPEVRPFLTEADQSLDARLLAADVLTQIRTPEAIGVLAKELMRLRTLHGYEASIIKQTAIDGLWMAGPSSFGALLALARLTEDADAEVRRKACRAIGSLGPQAEGVLPVLFDRLILDDSAAVQDAAAEAMSQLGPASVPLLVRTLEEGDDDLKWRAARALGNSGEYATSGISSLQRSLSETSNLVRLEACSALLKLANGQTSIENEVGRVCLEILPSTDRQHRRRAADVLISMKPLPPAIERRLKALAEESDMAASRLASYIIRERARRSTTETPDRPY